MRVLWGWCLPSLAGFHLISSAPFTHWPFVALSKRSGRAASSHARQTGSLKRWEKRPFPQPSTWEQARTADKPLLNLCRSSAVKLCLDDMYEPGHLTAALGNRRHTRRLMCGVAASRHPAHTCSSRSQAVVCHHGSCADTTVSAAAL